MDFPRSQTLSRADFRQHEELDCDVVVIGSGAGGAAAAYVLSAGGLRVLILEEGRRFDPEQLVTKTSWANRNLYMERALRFTTGNLYIPLAGGRTVGGSTMLNSAICFRTPERVLRTWQHDHGIDWADPVALEPTFTELEGLIGVAKTQPFQARGNNLLFKAGAEKLGLKGDFISRNAPGCIGCGVCQLGCPIGGKGSVDRNLIPFSLSQGAALVTNAKAHRLLVERGAAVGVEAALLDPKTDRPELRLTVRAKKVVLCAGAIASPIFLLEQRLANGSGQVGRNLHVQPGTGMCARMPQVIDAWDGVTQGYYVDLGESILETFSSSPDLYYTQWPDLVGLDGMRHIASCGVMLGDDSHGTVEPGAGGRAKIRYDLGAHDKDRLVRGLQKISEVFFAVGALEVHPGLYGKGTAKSHDELVAICNPDVVGPEQLSVYASHPMGTCRMGTDPKTSVVDPDGQSHELKNLHLADASIFPTSLGVNPQITVMSASMTVARRMLRAG